MSTHAAAASASPVSETRAHVRAAARRLGAWLAGPVSAQGAALALAVYLVLAANWPLWLQLARIDAGVRSALALQVLITCGTAAAICAVSRLRRSCLEKAIGKTPWSAGDWHRAI